MHTESANLALVLNGPKLLQASPPVKGNLVTKEVWLQMSCVGKHSI